MQATPLAPADTASTFSKTSDGKVSRNSRKSQCIDAGEGRGSHVGKDTHP